MWVIAADADYAAGELRIAHHGAINCCHWCPATLDNYRDIRPEAPWRLQHEHRARCRLRVVMEESRLFGGLEVTF